MRENKKEYYELQKEKKHEYNKKYYQEHREEMLERQRQYNQEHKEKKAEYMKQYYDENKVNIKEHQKKYYNENKENWKKYQKYDTPIGRASTLVRAYNYADKEHNRGKCTLTAQWIVENIFTQKCAHCDKTGWKVIGCNRLDNSLPHTPDNVEPCCFECNKKLPRKKALTEETP